MDGRENAAVGIIRKSGKSFAGAPLNTDTIHTLARLANRLPLALNLRYRLVKRQRIAGFGPCRVIGGDVGCVFLGVTEKVADGYAQRACHAIQCPDVELHDVAVPEGMRGTVGQLRPAPERGDIEPLLLSDLAHAKVCHLLPPLKLGHYSKPAIGGQMQCPILLAHSRIGTAVPLHSGPRSQDAGTPPPVDCKHVTDSYKSRNVVRWVLKKGETMRFVSSTVTALALLLAAPVLAATAQSDTVTQTLALTLHGQVPPDRTFGAFYYVSPDTHPAGLVQFCGPEVEGGEPPSQVVSEDACAGEGMVYTAEVEFKRGSGVFVEFLTLSASDPRNTLETFAEIPELEEPESLRYATLDGDVTTTAAYTFAPGGSQSPGMPAAGAGGAGDAGLRVAAITAGLSFLAAGGYAVRRSRRTTGRV